MRFFIPDRRTRGGFQLFAYFTAGLFDVCIVTARVTPSLDAQTQRVSCMTSSRGGALRVAARAPVCISDALRRLGARQCTLEGDEGKEKEWVLGESEGKQ